MGEQYDAEWKRRMLADIKKNLRRRFPGVTEARRNEILEKQSRFLDGIINTDWSDFEYRSDPRRRAKQSEARAKRFPPETRVYVRLRALAERLGVPFQKKAPDSVWEDIGVELAMMQPEFWTSGPGRPRGRQNRVLAETSSKETLRKRRQREKKRQSKPRA